MENFNQKGLTLLIAKTGSGKTTLIANICAYLTAKRSIGGILLFSQTGKFNGDYAFLHPSLKFRKLDMNLISMIQATRERKIQNGESPSNLLIILDDVIGDAELRSEKFNQLISRARHTNLYILVSIQSVTSVRPFLRDNANVVSITKIDNLSRLHQYHDLCGFGTVKEFQNYMTKSVGIYEFHVANRKCPSKKISDCFCKIKPTLEIPKFMWEP
jgi:nucleoside-triphosphatase THEP1